MRKKSKPAFLSAAVMRRAFQARLLSVDASARRILWVRVEQLGGFENRSYRLRYLVKLRLRSGRTRTLRLRGSSELQDQTRRQAYLIMKYLWWHGFQSGPNQVARPVTFFSRWRLLVYHEVAGQPLPRALLGQRSAAVLFDRVAAWLALLHRLSPRTLRFEHTRAGRKQYWLQALAVLRSTGVLAETYLVRAINKTMAFEDRLARRRGRVLVHHDFHPGNILVAPQAIRVVDFTESRLSDPLVDVAAFLAQLELQFPYEDPARIRRWQRQFLRAYARHNKKVSLSGPRAEKIFRFIRYRIALQSYVGEYLLGKKYSPHKESILKPAW